MLRSKFSMLLQYWKKFWIQVG